MSDWPSDDAALQIGDDLIYEYGQWSNEHQRTPYSTLCRDFIPLEYSLKWWNLKSGKIRRC